MNSFALSMIKSNKALIWIKWNCKTFLKWKDSLQWSKENSTSASVLSTWESMSNEDSRKTEKLHTPETLFIGTDLPEYLEDGEHAHMPGE